MKVAARFSQPNLSPTHLMQVRYSGRTIAFPVKPSQAVYAHFKHVSGFPSEDGQGISLIRLHGIDNLIDRLISIKKSLGNSEQRARIDNMIASLESAKATIADSEVSAFVQTRAEDLHSFSQNVPAYHQVKSFDGLLFNISA
jgi:hypothetical protein